MKRILIILSILISQLHSSSQENIFVIVDISKSVKQADLVSAKQALQDVLSGNILSNAYVDGGNLQDLLPFKLKMGDKISLVKFGDQQTTLAIQPSPIVIQNIPNDIFTLINGSFPTDPKDNNTYFRLAKAKIAEYANLNKIKEYKLYIVSDEIDDNFSGGKPNYSSQYIMELADGYNTTKNPVIESPRTVVKLKNSSTQGFKLNFFPKVDVSKYTPPGGGIVINDDSVIQIRITSYSQGTKIKPIKINGSNLNIGWSCTNCPQGAKFTLIVSGMSGNKYRPKIPIVSTQGYSLNNVPGGDYRISVSGQNFSSNSDTVYITVNSGGGTGWIIPVLLLLAAGIAGYWFWNKKRQKKLDEDKVNKQDDIFSPGGSQGSSNSSNSGYF